MFVLFFRFNAEFVCKLVRKRCIKLVYLVANQPLCLLFLCFLCYFAFLDINLWKLYLTIIRLRLSESRRIFPETIYMENKYQRVVSLNQARVLSLGKLSPQKSCWNFPHGPFDVWNGTPLDGRRSKCIHKNASDTLIQSFAWKQR